MVVEDKKVGGKSSRQKGKQNQNEKLDEKLDEKLGGYSTPVVKEAIARVLKRVFALTNGVNMEDVEITYLRVRRATRRIWAQVSITRRESVSYKSTIDALLTIDKLYASSLRYNIDDVDKV
jgi:hypothetical protein